MTLDETEQIADTALVHVDRIHVPEIVTKEDLYCLWIMTEFGGDASCASSYLSDLFGLLLLLLELDLESCHVAHPINATAPRCTATSDTSPSRDVVGAADDIMSGMDISSHMDFAAAPAEVHAMLTDERFLTEVCVASESLSYHVSVDGSTTRTSRTLPAPDSAARFTGPQLTVNDEIVWAEAASDGSRSATVTMTVLGQPVTFKGGLRLSPGGRGSVVDVRGQLKVAIPLLSRKLEESAAPAVTASYRTQQEVGNRWLAQ